METGYPKAVVSLVSLADGTTSLYISNGGGFIGGGQYEPVAQASKSFVTAAEGYFSKMTLTDSFPSPAPERVKFYILTYSGIYTADIEEIDLVGNNHELSTLYYYGHKVITQLRLVQEQKK